MCEGSLSAGRRPEHNRPQLPPSAQFVLGERIVFVITGATFVDDLLSALPEANEMVREHLDDQDGEILLHLLMADLLRLGVAAFESARTDEALRMLHFVDRCLAEGDDYVTNAVHVSFVEDYGAGPNEPGSVLTLWPAALRADLGR